MHYKLILTAVISVLTGFSSQACEKLVWADEFDYEGKPDSRKWGYDTGGSGWGNNEEQYYTSKQENACVENGFLTIKAIKEQFQGSNYTSARLITKNKGDWKYGRFEIRAKLPRGRGTWPAIWMLPTDWEYGGWPSSGEIDIMEHVGYDMNNIHGTVHTSAYNHLKGTQKGGNKKLNEVADEFHVYSIEWGEKQIDFFIDGLKYFTFYKDNDDYRNWPFDKRFHLILNIAIGGNWGGAQGIDNSIFPTEMVVDYVRVYQSFNDLEIYGPDVVVKFQKGLKFTCADIPDVIYQWSVPSDAVIISGQGTNQVVVDWGEENGEVSVKTIDNKECDDLTGEVNVSISYVPDGFKFLIDDFEENHFGSFNENSSVTTANKNGLFHLTTSKENEELVYTFREHLNIQDLPLLKATFKGNGSSQNLATLYLEDANGSRTEAVKLNFEPNTQWHTLHLGTDFTAASNEINIQKVAKMVFVMSGVSQQLSLDEIALYSTNAAPKAPRNLRLFTDGQKYMLWWEDSENALNYDVLFSPEEDGEYYGLYSNILGNEIPQEVAFTSVRKYFRVVAKNNAGVSERSEPVSQMSTAIPSQSVDFDCYEIKNEQLVMNRDQALVAVYDLSGKEVIGWTKNTVIDLQGLSGVFVITCLIDDQYHTEKIRLK